MQKNIQKSNKSNFSNILRRIQTKAAVYGVAGILMVSGAAFAPSAFARDSVSFNCSGLQFVNKTERGKIVNIKIIPIHMRQRRNNLLAAAAGAAGGSRFGHGNGRTAMSALGAIIASKLTGSSTKQSLMIGLGAAAGERIFGGGNGKTLTAAAGALGAAALSNRYFSNNHTQYITEYTIRLRNGRSLRIATHKSNTFAIGEKVVEQKGGFNNNKTCLESETEYNNSPFN